MALVARGVPSSLVYLGTPEVAVPPLEALVAAGFEIALVVTRVDKRRGRGSELSPSPVKACAQRLGLPVSHSLDDVATCGADLGVVVAYGRIIPAAVLERVAMVNLHFSLLPRWRGAAPVERALLAGDDETGVDLMALEEGLDTGPIYRRTVVPIGQDDTLSSLRGRLVSIGSALLVDSLRDGLGEPTAQQGVETYAVKIDPSELRIDWSRSAVEIDRLVRLGGAWTEFRGKRLKVHRVELVEEGEASPLTERVPGMLDRVDVMCGDGVLRLLEVQPEGKAMMSATAWRNGAQPTATEVLV
jgi:methionyl-tRNA formyltransferase